MASLTIHNLEYGLKRRLKARAAKNGRSMAQEAHHVLREALYRDEPETMVDIARELFGPKHGFELDLPPRHHFRSPPDFGASEDR
jgi:plasmid stability protein